MLYLSFLGLENFRAFSEHIQFDLAPITVLTGPNCSGKSSIIKALLLFNDNFQKKKGIEALNELDFSGMHHNLGDFSKAIYNNDIGRNIMFEFPFKFRGIKDNLILSLTYNFNKENELKNGKLINIELKSLKNLKNVYSLRLMEIEKKAELIIDFEFFRNKLDEIAEENYKEAVKHDNYYKRLKELSDKENRTKDENHEIYDLGNIIEYNTNYLNSFCELNYPKELNYYANPNDEFLYDYSELYTNYYEFFSNKIFAENEILKNEEIKFLSNFKFLFDFKSIEELPDHPHITNKIPFNISTSFNYLKSFDFSLTHDYYGQKKYINNIESNQILKENKHFADLYLKSLLNSSENKSCKFFLNTFLNKGFENSIEDFVDKIKNISFMDAVRANMQRVYTNQTQGTAFNELLLEYHKLNKSSNEFEKYINFINRYLKDIAGELSIERDDEGIGTKIYIEKENKKRLIVDYGYGVTQLLPILLKIAILASNSYIERSIFHFPNLLIIEEPETNLHPKLQSQLADIFVEANNSFDIQFVIETHSEYLIRKLQYLTAKKEIKVEDTMIYYLHDPNSIPKGEKQVKKINILEDGRLSDDFGSGFFDESANLMIDLYKYSNPN